MIPPAAVTGEQPASAEELRREDQPPGQTVDGVRHRAPPLPEAGAIEEIHLARRVWGDFAQVHFLAAPRRVGPRERRGDAGERPGIGRIELDRHGWEIDPAIGRDVESRMKCEDERKIRQGGIVERVFRAGRRDRRLGA